MGVAFGRDVLVAHGHVRRAVPDPRLEFGQGGSQLRGQRRAGVTASSLYNTRTNELAPACAKLVASLGSAPALQTKNPKHRRELRRLMDTKIRFATKDDCSIGILARRPE